MKDYFKGKYGPLLIAEIGGNHEGNFEYAKKLAQLAIDSKVDYVKFQIYTGDSLVSKIESPTRNQHFKKFELTKENHIELAEMVIKAGLKYTSSVWDLDAMDWIEPYISLFKIGSGDLTAYPILKATAKIGKPIILSTGLSNEEEVIESVRFIQECNPIYNSSEMLAILQCTSMYPIKNSDANLNVMGSLKSKLNLTVGYSDHTEGTKALQYAYAMGADVLEFHFTDSREGKEFRDHKVSLTPSDIESLLTEISIINELRGNSIKQPVEIEISNGHVESFRRACYPSRDIRKGELLSEENLTILRPLQGIDAREYYNVLGKVCLRDFAKHEKLDFKFLE